jgi:hypothetical protein
LLVGGLSRSNWNEAMSSHLATAVTGGGTGNRRFTSRGLGGAERVRRDKTALGVTAADRKSFAHC